MPPRATRSTGHVSAEGPAKKLTSAVTRATKVTKSTPKPSTKAKESPHIKNAASRPKSKAAPKSVLAHPRGLREADHDSEPDNLPVAVARKSPKKAGTSGSKAKTATSRMESDVDADGESDVSNDESTPAKDRNLQMVVEIRPFFRAPTPSSSSEPPLTTQPASVAPTVSPPTSPHFSPVLPSIDLDNEDLRDAEQSSPDNPNIGPAAEHRDGDVHGHTEAESDAEVYRGGRFTQDQIALVRSKGLAFFSELDDLAKDWKRSAESVRRVALAAAPSKSQRNGNAWNAFQFSYRQSHPNTDPSVTASDYTLHTVKPAYTALIESFGGEDTDEWMEEAERLVAEHEGAKAASAKQVAQSGGDIARIMSSQKDKWTHDMRWLATMDIHTLFIMVTGNAASAAAHGQNECRLGSEEIADWYKSKFDMKIQLADIYRFILARRSQFDELREFTQDEMAKKRADELSNVYKTRTAVKDSLIQLFKPFVKFSVFPWTNLSKILVQHHLVITNIVPDEEFKNFGSSYSDLHGTEDFKALYFALEEKSPEKRITVTKLDNWPDSDTEDIALITDRNGNVLLTLQAAKDEWANKKSDELRESAGVKRRGVEVGLESSRMLKRSRGTPMIKDVVGGSRRNLKSMRKGLGPPKSHPFISAEDDGLPVSESTPSGSYRTSGVSDMSDDSELAVSPYIGPSQVRFPQPQPRPKPRYSVPDTTLDPPTQESFTPNLSMLDLSMPRAPMLNTLAAPAPTMPMLPLDGIDFNFAPWDSSTLDRLAAEVHSTGTSTDYTPSILSLSQTSSQHATGVPNSVPGFETPYLYADS